MIVKDYWDRVEWPGIEGGLIKGSSKYYFSSLGATHDSFDLNSHKVADWKKNQLEYQLQEITTL